MKSIIVFIFILIGTVVPCMTLADDGTLENPALSKMSKDTRTAILNMDKGYIMKHVSPKGIYFIDKVYSKEQINNLLDDRDSWLYKKLYIGETSAKYFFENAHDISEKVYKRGVDAIMILYQSGGNDKESSLESCYIKVNGVWYFDGIFNCE
jgi:hypothetical protein